MAAVSAGRRTPYCPWPTAEGYGAASRSATRQATTCSRASTARVRTSTSSSPKIAASRKSGKITRTVLLISALSNGLGRLPLSAQRTGRSDRRHSATDTNGDADHRAAGTHRTGYRAVARTNSAGAGGARGAGRTIPAGKQIGRLVSAARRTPSRPTWKRSLVPPNSAYPWISQGFHIWKNSAARPRQRKTCSTPWIGSIASKGNPPSGSYRSMSLFPLTSTNS